MAECRHKELKRKEMDMIDKDEEDEYERKQPWFHHVDREQAMNMLQGKEVGTFLVRPSSIPAHYAVSSVNHNGKIVHYLIHRFFPGFGYMCNDDKNDYMDQVGSLRQYLCKNPRFKVPIVANDFKSQDIVNFAVDQAIKRRRKLKEKTSSIPLNYVWTVILNELGVSAKSCFLALSSTCSSMYSVATPILERSFTYNLFPGWWMYVSILPARVVCSSQEISHLPPSVTHLTTFSAFNDNIDGLLPNTITHLTFGQRFNKKALSLPTSLTHLTFGQDFNSSVDCSHLLSLKHLVFGNSYTKCIPPLSPSITHLELGNQFNRPLDLSYSLSLKHLILGKCFNQPVNQLPPYLTHLTFGGCINVFNKRIDNLPSSLTHLILGFEFNLPTDLLPCSITHLTFGDSYDHPITRLPASVTHLVLGDKFNKRVDCCSKLQSLTIGNSFDQSLDSLPPTLIHLSIGKSFNQRLPPLPASLAKLILGKHFNQPLPSLPHSLTHLTLGDYYNINPPPLPPRLHKLEVGYKFNFPLALTSCPHLHYLALDHDFDFPIDFVPPSLTVLVLHSKYRFSVPALKAGATLAKTHRTEI